MKSINLRQAFTIVELVIVVIVIAILATIVIVAYNGVTNNAKTAAVQSNLATFAQKLDNYALHNGGSYPLDLSDGDITVPDTGTYNYRSFGDTYCLAGSTDSTTYVITDSDPTPKEGVCSGILANGTNCPDGFIAVPGNSNLGTSDFCIMKYEAKIQGQTNGNQTYSAAFVAESRAAGTPWVSITQTNAITEASAVCDGCHLVTEAEWMTVAANVLSVPDNWSNDSVGSGYIYQGHVNSNPSSALAASSSDNDGDYGITGGTGSTSGTNSQRTLTLTNGEVIWDLSGNVWEWTQGTIAGNQQPGLSSDASYVYKDWNNGSMLWGSLPTNSRPSALASTSGLSSINSWTYSNGIGRLVSNYNSSDSTRSFIRGGVWNDTTNAGVTTLNISNVAGITSGAVGFRAAQ